MVGSPSGAAVEQHPSIGVGWGTAASKMATPKLALWRNIVWRTVGGSQCLSSVEGGRLLTTYLDAPSGLGADHVAQDGLAQLTVEVLITRNDIWLLEHI